MSLMKELIIRAILVISITDAIIFFIINRGNPGVITITFAVLVIVVTIVPMVLGIWFAFYRRKIKESHSNKEETL